MGTLARIRSLLWHPHQGLWNWRLARRASKLPAGRLLDHGLVAVDSVWLALRCAARTSSTGIDDARVLYVDCGVHTEGLEIVAVDRWFRGRVARLDILAFEANPAHFKKAERNLEGIESMDLRNLALVGPDHHEQVATLHLAGGPGKGDSLFTVREKVGAIEVPARRLSAMLPESDAYDAVILRMNIEGAEQFVIDDLVAAGSIGRIDGYYGMWDDLSKIDPPRDAAFRAQLASIGVRPLTFNDRDFENPDWERRSRPRLSAKVRLWAIRRHMEATIARAAG